MPHDIIDNRNEKLVDHIRRILPGSQAAKFAVGYFFLSGLEAVSDVLENVQELRLLIGNTSNRETIEQIAEGYRRLEQVEDAAEEMAYPGRAQMNEGARATAANIGETAALLDQTAEAEDLIGTLVRLIREGRLHVRIYTRGRLHAKAYIFDYGQTYDAQGEPLPREEKGIAIVGSSNLSLAGISSNTELNVVVHGNANHAELTRWFQELWSEALPFDEQLMEEMRASWALAEVTPYEIYLKTLYELVRGRLEEADEEVFLWHHDIMEALTDFQDRAVRRAIGMVREYRGCFIADVVGLGKSYVGSAVLKHFAEVERARPLIICPASLTDMWERYNEIYDLNARVLSMGMLVEDDRWGPEWMLHDDLYRHRDLVLVDESHNFRHSDTQRYRVLQSYLAPGDRRCVFLTATPRNSSGWDLYHQIKLFHQDEVTDLPIDPPHLRTFFNRVEEGTRRLPELLSHLLIRRRRAQVLRWYGYDAGTDERIDPDHFGPYKRGERRAYVRVGGEKQFFPQRELTNIEYSIEDTYQGLYGRIRHYISGADGHARARDDDSLTYARYGLGNYVLADKRQRPPYRELQTAGRNLRGLMRIMLFKRFESSVHAFRETVRRMLVSHRGFLTALDKGIVPAGEEARRILYESDRLEEWQLVEALRETCGDYEAQDFDARRLRADIEQDIGILERLLEIAEPITPRKDHKLQTLLRWLQKPALSQGKRLIFTQYADTAQYLHDNLTSLYPDADVIYSQQKNKAATVARFAPQANLQQRERVDGEEIDTLIATDILAEGLNLQDCDKVVNYDLHWTPVRLIQRLGRIDRIGSEHDTIYAYNFLPETGLERNLGLQERLERRIQEIHETIGEDAAILDPNERLNEDAMYAIYAEGEVGQFESEADEDDFVDLNEAEEIIRHLREDDPELYEHIVALRDGVRCARATGDGYTYTFCRAGRYRQLYLMDDEGALVTQEIPRILGWLECAPDTSAVSLPADHNERVMAIKRRFDEQVEARRAEREHTVSQTRAQRYVRRELNILYDETEDEALRQQIRLLRHVFGQSIHRPAVRTELDRLQRQGAHGVPLVRDLGRIYSQYNLSPAEQNASRRRDENDEIPRIVCSEAGVELPGTSEVPGS